MANPSRYEQSYDFSAFQENNPSTPLPAVQVDVQLADIQTSTTELRDAIMDIRRSDGALMNEIVTEDSLAPGLLDTLTAATDATAIHVAAEAIEDAEELAEAAAAQLQGVADLIAAGGYFVDDGLITEEPGTILDDGTII